MRLPKIDEVGGMSRMVHSQSPGAAATIAAGDTAVMLKGIGSLAQTGVEILREKEYEQQQQSGRDYLLKQREHSITWDKIYGSKTEFTLGEIDDKTRQELGITEDKYPDGVVPGYVVKTDMKSNYLNEYLQSDSTMITDEGIRTSAMQTAQGYELTDRVQNVKQSMVGQKLYHKTDTMKKYNAAWNEGDLATAIAVAEHSDLSSEAKNKLVTNATAEWQREDLNNLLNAGGIPIWQKSIDKLENEEFANQWAFSEAETQAYIKRFKGQIKAQTSVNSNSAKTVVALDRDMARKMATARGTNDYTGDPMDYVRVYNTMKNSEVPTDQVLARNMKIANEFAGEMEGLMKLPPAAWADGLNHVQSNAGELDWYVANKQNEAVIKERKLLSTDPMTFGQKWNAIEFKPLDVENLTESLMGRVLPERTMRDKYNNSTGFLTAPEADGFFTDLNSKTANQKMAIYAQVDAGLGENSAYFYEQGKGSGISQSAAIAGQKFSENPQTSKMIVEGADIRKSEIGDKILPASVKQDIYDSYAKELGGVYGSNTRQISAVIESILDVYAWKANDTGNRTGVYDSDIAKESYMAVTGGIVTFYGANIEAPEPGMSSTETKAAFKRVPATFYDKQIEGWTGAQTKESVDNGRVKLIERGKGIYALYDVAGKFYLKQIGLDVPYLLHYEDAKNYQVPGDEPGDMTLEERNALFERNRSAFSNVPRWPKR